MTFRKCSSPHHTFVLYTHSISNTKEIANNGQCRRSWCWLKANRYTRVSVAIGTNSWSTLTFRKSVESSRLKGGSSLFDSTRQAVTERKETTKQSIFTSTFVFTVRLTSLRQEATQGARRRRTTGRERHTQINIKTYSNGIDWCRFLRPTTKKPLHSRQQEEEKKKWKKKRQRNNKDRLTWFSLFPVSPFLFFSLSLFSTSILYFFSFSLAFFICPSLFFTTLLFSC